MNTSAKPYLTTLTPLRGIAALLVVIFHSNLMMFMPFLPMGKPHLIWAGWLWVDFFFVLSGFIISYVYGDAFKDTITSGDYWKYIKARFARVYPLHLVTLVWCLICAVIILHYADGVAPFFSDMLSPSAAIPSLFFLQSLGLYITAPLNTPSWSLSTEWWVYMVFPLVVPLFSRLKAGGMAAMFLCIGGLFLFIKYFLGPVGLPFPGGSPSLNIITDFGVFRCLAGFLLGMLLFRVYEESIAINFFSKSWVFVAFFMAVIVAMQFGVEDILVIGLFPFVILAAAYNNTMIKKVLDTPVLQRLGDWSFSIYMVHVPIMYVFLIYQIRVDPIMLAKFPAEPAGPPNYTLGLIVCIIVVALTLIISALSYRFVEVPARRYLNKRFTPKILETVEVTN
jgi:peptidoglycan/LPS O-acetylase OafA/YrhL